MPLCASDLLGTWHQRKVSVARLILGKGKEDEGSIPDLLELASAIAEWCQVFSVNWNGRLSKPHTTVTHIVSRTGFSFPLWPPASFCLNTVCSINIYSPGSGCACVWSPTAHALRSGSFLILIPCAGWQSESKATVRSSTRLLSWAFQHLYGPVFQGSLLPLVTYLLHLDGYLTDSTFAVLVRLVPSDVPHRF